VKAKPKEASKVYTLRMRPSVMGKLRQEGYDVAELVRDFLLKTAKVPKKCPACGQSVKKRKGPNYPDELSEIGNALQILKTNTAIVFSKNETIINAVIKLHKAFNKIRKLEADKYS